MLYKRYRPNKMNTSCFLEGVATGAWVRESEVVLWRGWNGGMRAMGVWVIES